MPANARLPKVHLDICMPVPDLNAARMLQDHRRAATTISRATSEARCIRCATREVGGDPLGAVPIPSRRHLVAVARPGSAPGRGPHVHPNWARPMARAVVTRSLSPRISNGHLILGGGGNEDYEQPRGTGCARIDDIMILAGTFRPGLASMITALTAGPEP